MNTLLTQLGPAAGRRLILLSRWACPAAATPPPSLEMQQRRPCSSGEIKTRGSSLDYWGRKGHLKPSYPRTTPKRQPGLDLNLQERLDLLYAERNERRKNRKDIGFPAKKSETAADNRSKMLAFRREQRANAALERASRTRTLKVDLDEVKREHAKSGALFRDVWRAADHYGVFDDLFGEHEAHFTPVVNLEVRYDFDEDTVTPVHRGNIIKPKEATTRPEVIFDLDADADAKDSLWTLVMTNLDGHFTDETSEYLHWMVGNIKGNDVSSGVTLANYLQPFPAKGTGYHRHAFVLYKQTGEIDYSPLQLSPPQTTDLASRSFRTRDFFARHANQLTPAGLAFFQSDWDSTLTDFYHNVLDMAEPRYEYHFVKPYVAPWNTLFPRRFRQGFNLFLDRYRDPKAIQEEVLTKKLRSSHPFKGDMDAWIKFPNAHIIDKNLPQWRRREIERERLRQGTYKDMDWKELRRDPTDA